jgi:FtsX extracellular domain
VSGPSLWWIDWSLHGGSMRKEAAGRFLLCFLAALYFMTMLLSGGVNRFLSGQFTITAMMHIGVPDEEGMGIAAKAAVLAPVREAHYRTPDEAWEEFLAAYPGLETLRSGGENPLPGYVEIGLRPERMSEEGIAEVRSALAPLSQVEKILSGGDVMPGLLRMKRWANALLWSGFALVCLAFLAILAMQERARAARLLPDVSFLAERGIPGSRIAVKRAAGAFLAGAAVAVLATGASFLALLIASDRFSPVRTVVGSAEELLDVRFLPAVFVFLLSASIFPGLASLSGWRAAYPKGR